MPSESFVSAFRWFLLIGGIMNALQATVLFEWTQRVIIGRWIAITERFGAPPPAFMVNRRLHRVFMLLNAMLFLGMWWFLGTPEGATFVHGLTAAPSR